MKNKIKTFLLIITCVLIFTGCFKRDNMEGINIITTVYPLEYISTRLYGENSVINSIYPDGINIQEYKISSKEYKDFSKQDLFIYNGLTTDRDIALKLLNKNKDILIMDANFGMEFQYGIEELWLNPSNLLMISQNIKNSLSELIDSKYIKDEINSSYEELKVELSELDADIKLLSENAKNKTIVVASKSLQYLNKYGFDVIFIDDNTTKSMALQNGDVDVVENKTTANDLKTIKYIYILENDKESKIFEQLKSDKKITSLTIDKIDNITDEQRDNKEDYITLMKQNIELLKKGIE